MDKENYYKKLYLDIMTDTYDGKSIMINNNKKLLKELFSKCSKSMLSEGNFSFAYIKRCLDFVSRLTEEEQEMIDDGFLSFFNILNNDSFNIMKYLLHPNANDTMYYIPKILGNSSYFGSNNLNTNNINLKNLNDALVYFKSINNDQYNVNIIILLFVFCSMLNQYCYLYNYLNNPSYYIDKLYNSGILNEYELYAISNNSFHFISGYKYLYNKLINNFQFIFSFQKKMIR